MSPHSNSVNMPTARQWDIQRAKFGTAKSIDQNEMIECSILPELLTKQDKVLI